ncbi:MAG: hypothetical protein OZSIB_0377 [Candidatus Ozemobacter sibiricus]|jgi:prepilin-type N-terminal cleavage/methylation domain-containing protein|uniref:Prepilin-type N-terminal cleavage/methylation domain-containing protein n=1 Tax=Candidatus Ozemobacter sibiricus TaxID=2268124 RepID=A0A367ZLQ1_9BACT|nr:MAG: hypothetical protein OZSIB_0377 [Candidatus Ozemobacter sibiricus]
MARQPGFTLVEIMVAVAIVAIAFIPILGLITTDYTLATKTVNQSKGGALVSKLIEEVKHVPFATYQKECPELLQEKPLPIPEKYYPETSASLLALKQAADREYWLEATMQGAKNEAGQLVEIYFQAEIRWRDRGGRETTTQEERRLRAAALIFNPETKF